MSDAGIIILTGALAAAACALPGAFLVLRGMSLLGDAISHAVLPGIVVAFLLTGSVSSWPVVIGAGITGLVAVVLIELLTRSRRLKADAAIAVVFPALFALGVLLIAQYAGQTDLDQECVLYGEILHAPLDVIQVGDALVSRPALVLGVVAILNLVLVFVLYKELKVATFDAAFASAIGLSPVLVHYALMTSVSLTTVASFESIGAILVVAFLIVPPAAAHLLTDRLGLMLALSVAIGAVSAAAGYLVAARLDASIAGCMAGAMGASFFVAWLISPRKGLLAQMIRRHRQRRRFAAALLLERLARGARADAEGGGVIGWLLREGMVETRDGGFRPTESGVRFAREVGGSVGL